LKQLKKKDITMFNKTIIEQRTNNSYVTEKRAPTDESVRLLREMEASARLEVIKSIQLPSNEFSGVIHMMRDFMSCNTNIAVMFKLNGKDHKVLISLEDFKDVSLDKRIEKIVNETSKYLAANILQSIFKSEQIRELGKAST
jgi:hypothetical protein